MGKVRQRARSFKVRTPRCAHRQAPDSKLLTTTQMPPKLHTTASHIQAKSCVPAPMDSTQLPWGPLVIGPPLRASVFLSGLWETGVD